MVESFAPSVIVDGKAYTPPGWMWVLSFALAGVEWAIREADTPEFRKVVRVWTVENQNRKIQQEIADYERRLVLLRKELHINESTIVAAEATGGDDAEQD